MSLLALQRGFRDHLLAGADRVLPTVRAAAMRGLAVYRHAYRAQLTACLRDSYAKTWAWLGDDAFDAAARRYVDSHPPSSWTLNDYGAGFAETLRALHPDDPEVGELAWLDWALRRAFDGPDSETIGPRRWRKSIGTTRLSTSCRRSRCRN